MTKLQLALGISLVVAGCKTQTMPPGATDDYAGRDLPCIDRDGDGFGLNCAAGSDCDDTNSTISIDCPRPCDHPSPGCPCATENARAQCGKVASQSGTQTTCSYGEIACQSGAWGECVADGKSIKTFDLSRRIQGLNPAVPCGIACDPYCQQFPDTPDDTLSTPQGLLGTDAGLTLTQSDAHPRPYSPNGPMPGNVQTALQDAGLYPDAQPDAIIYHELPQTTTAQDPVAAINVVPPKSVDVYLLEQAVGTMGNTLAVVRDQVPAVGGTADQVRATVPDARFGAGKFQTYGLNPYTGTASTVFQHVLAPTIDNGLLTTALQYIVSQNFALSLSNPRAWMPAIYAVATTGGMLTGVPGTWWVPQRADWTPPIASGEGGPCPAGTSGYPCFRSTAVPVTVVITDAPSINGPGGQYSAPRTTANSWNLSGAALWTSGVTPTPVGQNPTEALARAIDPAGGYAAYTGYTNNDTDAAKNNNWPGAGYGQCGDDRGLNARNSYFGFTLASRTWYHFDAIGSNYNAVIYLYRKDGATNTYLSCNDLTPLGTGFGDPNWIPTSIDGVLDAGQYFLVIDGHSGQEGQYVLHVNGMADGPSATSLAAPNYDQALAAYNMIGGKIVGIDVSGYGCDVAPHINTPRWLTHNTSNALEKLLRDTGSLDAMGNPAFIQLSNWGDACHAGDPAFAGKLAQDILDVTAPIRAIATRADVTAVAIDTDDAIDYDGPPGGAVQLTPVNINDATFVTSFATVSTAETMANCTAIQANQYVGCTTGTPVTFIVNIQTPATVPLLYQDQIFTFVVRILSNGTILAEIPVVVLVPRLEPYMGDAWFVRDFDTTSVCPSGTAPVWGTWAWNATTPGDSKIDFDVSVAPSAMDLTTPMTPAIPIDPLQFSTNPMALVGQAIGARVDNMGLDTQFGATRVDFTLAAKMRARDSRALRVRSHLVPTTDNTLAPILRSWNLSVSCEPAE